MENERLTSSEISNIWTHYIRESLSICIMKYMLNIVKDPQIHSAFEMALTMSQKHIKVMESLFYQENFPTPKGFTEEDVHLDAPPLFTDHFCLLDLHAISIQGSQAYSLAFGVAVREDIRNFYYQCNIDSMDMCNKTNEVLSSKGLLEKPPYFITPKKSTTIKSLKYVTDVFGETRKLNTIESGNLFFNLQKSLIAKGIFLAFEQCCKDKEVKQFLAKGVDMANKHIGVFGNVLLKENLHSPKSLESEITNSTVAPFSDKLMLFLSGFLVAAAISYYGTASVAVMRADLSMHCEKAILDDLLLYGSFGKLAIQKNWIEQPPESDDRRTV